MPYLLFVLRIEQCETCRTRDVLLRRVEQTCRDAHLVALTYKTRNIRLHHHRLLRHRLAFEHAAVHVLVVRNAHELPCGYAFRKSELYTDISLFVSCETGIEERRLVEVLTHLGRLFRVGL